MANKAITLLQEGNSNIMYTIVDTDTNIDALWATAGSLVNGFMDFTSVPQRRLGYAKLAKRYLAGFTVDVSGNVTGGTVQTTFDAGVNRPPQQIGPPQPTDGTATVATLAKAVDNIQAAIVNSGIATQASS
jgi:hypothetical protein